MQARHNCYKLPLIRKLIAEIDRELEGEGGKSAEEDEAEQEQSAPTTQISASPGEKGEQTSVFSGVACIGEAQGLQKAEERGQGSEQGRAASPVQKLWPGTATAACSRRGTRRRAAS